MTLLNFIILSLTLISGFLIVYHHVFFPLILKIIMKNKRKKAGGQPSPEFLPRRLCDPEDERFLPEICLIIPAYNEAEMIADKIANLATIDYPPDKWKAVIYCDGCTDDTAKLAREALMQPECEALDIRVIEGKINRGKVAVINELMEQVTGEIIGLSDVSALISIDAFWIAAQHFVDRKVGVVAGSYNILTSLGSGEDTYWRYQVEVKKGESALGSPIGVHGAFYLFRRDCFTALPADTINDDFILPMDIVAQGYRAVYETAIMAVELEQADNALDYRRRCRIAAGNVQQVVRLRQMLSPRFGGVAFAFASGKALRAVMPIFLLVCLLGTLCLAIILSSPWNALFGAGFAMQIGVYALAGLRQILNAQSFPKIVETIHYIVSGHLAGLIGLVHFVSGKNKGRWHRAQIIPKGNQSFIPFSVAIMKRCFDIVFALIGLTIGMALFPFIALAIKLDSPGPVIYRQQRIGRALPTMTSLFWIYKFRSMVQDAEAKTGAVWASKNDSRITKIGNFMRKTRLDEIPQLWNVLRGDMSLIGPRPERPTLTGQLDKKVPLFAERTYGLRPGITGLAQVLNGYDTSIEDVRNKAAYDHAYAVSLSTLRSWVFMEVNVLWKTVAVVALGRGQ